MSLPASHLASALCNASAERTFSHLTTAQGFRGWCLGMMDCTDEGQGLLRGGQLLLGRAQPGGGVVREALQHPPHRRAAFLQHLVGDAVRRAIERSDCNAAVLASGSLSHKLVQNEQVGDTQWDVVSSEFNRQMDLHVLTLWKERRFAEFARMLPKYCTKCNGEALMADTVMLFGLLGWDRYAGRSEQLCGYFPSSGTGQVAVEFHLAA